MSSGASMGMHLNVHSFLGFNSRLAAYFRVMHVNFAPTSAYVTFEIRTKKCV